ncbi:MAG: aminopeptidase [Candidatus Nanoarchaeia archaeon]|nr:aminopeptidase [Candidatus Nanoarchaeia archaeon]MDD5053942.1 aminopeptidase [Candidatus Nanoarchaeia archaeon]MDD5499309.1 aminopeptidase [Candidatus Nanoarchaeia archaeon]
MKDSRISALADILVNYSTKVKEDDVVIIAFGVLGTPLALEICNEVVKKGAEPFFNFVPEQATLDRFNYASEEYLRKEPKMLKSIVENADVYISIYDDSNKNAFNNVNPEKIKINSQTRGPILAPIYGKRWCAVLFPTNAYAQDSEMSLEEYEKFVFDAVLIDWENESAKWKKLEQILTNGSEVRVVGKETDLKMSIKGRIGITSNGTHNMPGGEVFISPVPDSVNGKIYFDLPAMRGKEVNDVYFEFNNGVLDNFSAGRNQDFLESMINMDKGSKRVGEFGIGTNYGIKQFTKNILFDEKIGGTIHLALGKDFEESFPESIRSNKKELESLRNVSSLHWDFIKSLKDFGELYVDDKLIQLNGEFIKGILG